MGLRGLGAFRIKHSRAWILGSLAPFFPQIPCYHGIRTHQPRFIVVLVASWVCLITMTDVHPPKIELDLGRPRCTCTDTLNVPGTTPCVLPKTLNPEGQQRLMPGSGSSRETWLIWPLGDQLVRGALVAKRV